MRREKVEKLWVEKYRPKKIDDVIFQNAAHRKFFEDIARSGELPNLLLAGVQGTGKTTLSHVLLNELKIPPSDVLKIKCSDETGVDAMRDKLSRFAETVAQGNFKVVQMEEADYLSHNAQAVLRHIVEDSSGNCRFIFTCNNASRLMPPVKSRLQEFHFKAPSQEDVLIKMGEMLIMENVNLDEDGSLDLLEKIVVATYPDIRKTINVLYQCTRSGKLTWIDDSSSGVDFKLELLQLIESGDFTAARKLVCDNVQREEYEELFHWLYQNIHRAPKFQSADKQEAAIVTIADYEYKSSFMAHQDLNAAALFITLKNL